VAISPRTLVPADPSEEPQVNWNEGAHRLHALARTTEDIVEAVRPTPPAAVLASIEEATACIREAARRLALFAAGKEDR